MRDKITRRSALVGMGIGISGIGSLAQKAWGSQEKSQNRITVLFDAFGEPSELKQDWGFSALVEYQGKRILFDTGNDADIFEHNVKSLGVDLKKLDCVVISHRHGDHTNGLKYLLKVNPTVTIYVPAEEHFGGPTPEGFYRRTVESLPKKMRYFNGTSPDSVPHGTAWRGAKLARVESNREIMKGVRLIATTSQVAGTLEMPELSLSLQSPEGQVMLVGCSHPGIETILGKADAESNPVRLLVGGLHLVTTPESDIQRIGLTLRDKWKIKRIAAAHCTGEPGFAALMKIFADRYVYAGLGTVIPIP